MRFWCGRQGRLLAAASVLAVMPSVASAQQSEPSGPIEEQPEVPAGAQAQETGGPAEGGLADIVVTAQRRAENLQRVPIAITAATDEMLDASAIVTTVQLNAIAPGLNVRIGNGSFNPFIRGIGTSSNIVENPVALYIDGVYLAQQREGLREINDIEQITVLKGPQGTLFGRNATGGVIQITTKAPSRTFRAEMGAELDNYLTLRTDAYVTGPISDTLAFSLSGQYAKQFEGYGENRTTGNDTYQLRKQIAVRGKLLFEPADGTRVTLIGDYMDREAQALSFRPLLGTKFSLPGFGPSESRYDTYAGVDPFGNFQGGGVSLTIDHELDFARFVSISAYRKGDAQTQLSSTADPANLFLVDYFNAPNEMYSQELQLLSNPGRFNWVLGAFYFNNRNAGLPITVRFSGLLAPLPTSPRQIDNFGDERAESLAGFGQFNWEFIENTTLTGGARWTWERRSAELSRVITFNSGFVVRPPTVDDSVTFREPTFRLALSHEFSPNILGYVSFNSGFKSGGFNITNSTNPSYLPEKLKAYEAGLKTQLLDRRLRLNMAAYYYDYTNLQVARFSQGTQTIGNGAAAKLYGLDVDIEAQITDGLRLFGGLALEHTEFTSYPNAVFGFPQPNGSVILMPGDAKGNRLPLAQEVSGTLGLDYHHELPSGAVDASVTANYNGDFFFEADNGVLCQDDYVMLNARLRYTLPGDRVSFSIFGRNLLDEAILTFPVTQTFGYDANYAPPRTYGVAVRFDF